MNTVTPQDICKTGLEIAQQTGYPINEIVDDIMKYHQDFGTLPTVKDYHRCKFNDLIEHINRRIDQGCESEEHSVLNQDIELSIFGKRILIPFNADTCQWLLDSIDVNDQDSLLPLIVPFVI